MKKSVLTVALASTLILGGSIIASANEGALSFGRGTSVKDIVETGVSFEEAKQAKLEEKVQRVDAAVESGNLTSEEGEAIKNEMKERMNSCETPGQMKQERKGLGLGKQGKGMGCGQGRGQGSL